MEDKEEKLVRYLEDSHLVLKLGQVYTVYREVENGYLLKTNTGYVGVAKESVQVCL